MARAEQIDVSLDDYHRFVVRRFEKVLGTSRSGVVRYMVQAWVSDHSHQVEQASATFRDWDRERGGV
jgi:hypothetical protein